MTVRELLSELEKLSPDLKVIVRGYENGFNDVVAVKMRNIVETVNPEWWDGKYQEAHEKKIFVSAVEIFGDNFIKMH